MDRESCQTGGDIDSFLLGYLNLIWTQVGIHQVGLSKSTIARQLILPVNVQSKQMWRKL
jgi:hypothetical protein